MKELAELVNKTLLDCIEHGEPKNLFDSMRYSLMAGGKRLRPILCLEACRVLNGKIQDALPIACAIEMLHTQSLIHDDLPCMDNDDFRRGKPTNHKVFGEAVAVLAGDALILLAPQLIIQKSSLDDKRKLKIIEKYLLAAGAYGIVAGQVADIEQEGKPATQDDAKMLEFIHTHKTAALFTLALTSGAIAAGASEYEIGQMDIFGQKLGFAFQILDDILDEISTFEQLGKTAGKDVKAQKTTYTALYGLEKAKCEVTCLVGECRDILKKNEINSKIFDKILKEIQERAQA